jgi:hypothetical protein
MASALLKISKEGQNYVFGPHLRKLSSRWTKGEGCALRTRNQFNNMTNTVFGMCSQYLELRLFSNNIDLG